MSPNIFPTHLPAPTLPNTNVLDINTPSIIPTETIITTSNNITTNVKYETTPTPAQQTVSYSSRFNQLFTSIGNTITQTISSYTYESLEVTKSQEEINENVQNKEKEFYKSDPANRATIAYVIYAAPEVLTGKRYFNIHLF